MKLCLVRVNLGDGEVSDEEEDTKTNENAKVPPGVAPEILEREIHISVAVDVRLAWDCPNDRTSLVLDGDSFITRARGNK